MNKLFKFFFVLVFIAGCKPSEAAIQTAVAKTQVTYTATATINPCSDRGWADIATYLKEFDKAAQNVVVGSSISAYMDGLTNITTKINEVKIDACSESARQMIVNSRTNYVQALILILTTNDTDRAGANMMVESINTLSKAKVELKALGISLNYP